VLFAGTVAANAFIAGTVTAGHIAAGAIGAGEIAANVVAVKHLLVGNFENLIPNGNSEQGTLVTGISPEGDNLVNEPSNAYAGNWCRKWVASAGGYYYPAFDEGDPLKRIKVNPGEEYRFTSYIKCTSGGATVGVYMVFFDSDANVTLNPNVTVETTGSYQLVALTGTAPANTTNIRFQFYAVDAGTYYIDNMFAKLKIDTSLIVDGAITAAKVGANEIIASSANLGNAVVSTIKIEDNAVTVPVSASATSTLGIGEGDANATEIISATITSHGQPIHIFFLVEHSTFNTSYDLHHHIYRDSTELRYYVDHLNAAYATVQFSILDQPSAGTYTYRIKSNTHSGGGTASSVYWRNLILLETQK
jgi:hypothetical protein